MSRFRRRLIALCAAYALALQPVLAAVASFAVAQEFAICASPAGAHGGGGSGPATHDHTAGCAVCPAAGGAVPVLPAVTGIASMLGLGTAMAMQVATAPIARAAARSGPARAPPASARSHLA